MLNFRAPRVLVCVLGCASMFGGHRVVGQSITFRRVVDTNTPIPGGTGNFTELDLRPSIRAGNVAFHAGGPDGQVGAYTEIGGVLGLVADTNTAIPGGSGSFTAFSTSFSEISSTSGDLSFDGANVVFQGLGASDQTGIYTNEGGTLRVVADTNTSIPGDAGNFAGFARNPKIDFGNIVFAGSDTPIVPPSSAAGGVYTEIGGVLSVVADTSTPVPGESATYSTFDYPALDGTDVSFRAFSIMSTSVIGLTTRIDDVFNVVMDVNTPIPGDTGTFNVFGVANLDGGNVVLLGGKELALSGVYTDLGGTLRVVADLNTQAPGGTVNFTHFFFGPSAAIDNGNIAFMGATSFVTFGMYAEMQGSLLKVVDKTDTLGTDNLVFLSGGPEALSGNEVAFMAAFADGSQAIFVATIPLDVCGNGILEMGEECDDQGESIDCDADCTFADCGDGTVNATAGEACDEGLANSDTLPNGCRTNCMAAMCGDGVLDFGEQCDDGNTIDGDGCQGGCLVPTCGDGIVDFGEQCDDGNGVRGDGCSPECDVEATGEAIPTVSQWGLIIMSLLLAISGKVHFGRRPVDQSHV